MAVTLDTIMNAGNGTGGLDNQAIGATSNSVAGGITVGVSATLLIVTLVWSGLGTAPTGVTVTWNGVSMSAGPNILAGTSGVRYAQSAIFYLVNPASGGKTLTANWTNSNDCYMSAISFKGTDTTTGVKIADNITAVNVTTITVTSDTNGATVANFVTDGANPTMNFNKIWVDSPDFPGGGGSYQLGGTSNAHTFTGAGGTFQALVGVHIISPAILGGQGLGATGNANYQWGGGEGNF